MGVCAAGMCCAKPTSVQSQADLCIFLNGTLICGGMRVHPLLVYATLLKRSPDNILVRPSHPRLQVRSANK